MKKGIKRAVSALALLIILGSVLMASAAWHDVEKLEGYAVGQSTGFYTWSDPSLTIKASIVQVDGTKKYKIECVQGSGWVVAGFPIPADKNNWTNVDQIEFRIDVRNKLKGSTPETGTGYQINLIDGKGEKFEPPATGYKYSLYAFEAWEEISQEGTNEVWLDDSRQYNERVRVKLAQFKTSQYQDTAGVATGTMQMKGFKEFRIGFAFSPDNNGEAGRYILIDDLRVDGNNVVLGTAAQSVPAPASSKSSSSAPSAATSKDASSTASIAATESSGSLTEESSAESAEPVSSAASAINESVAPTDNEPGKFPIVPVIIIAALLLLGGGGAALYFLVIKKNKI